MYQIRSIALRLQSSHRYYKVPSCDVSAPSAVVWHAASHLQRVWAGERNIKTGILVSQQM